MKFFWWVSFHSAQILYRCNLILTRIKLNAMTAFENAAAASIHTERRAQFQCIDKETEETDPKSNRKIGQKFIRKNCVHYNWQQ